MHLGPQGRLRTRFRISITETPATVRNPFQRKQKEKVTLIVTGMSNCVDRRRPTVRSM